MSRAGRIAFVTLLLALPGTSQVAADPMADFRLEEALRAMSDGEFERALDLSLLVVMQDENDSRAHREAGRAAHALGRFQIAIDHLSRALELQDSARDPEARYLLGEAYYASGREADAIRHHDRARREIAPTTENPMELMWLARIHARRGQVADADRIYLRLLETQPYNLEVLMARIEARTLSRKWADAEKLLRQFLAGHPDHPRATQMLAWVLEAQNKNDEERELRARLADDAKLGGGRRLLDHARALERTGEYRAAIDRYEQALDRAAVENDGAEVDEREVRAAVTRLTYRMTPETAVSGGFYSDPSGSFQRVRAGVAVPAHDAVTLALLASLEWAAGGAAPGAMPTSDVRIGTVDAVANFGQGQPVAGAITASGSHFSFGDGNSSSRIGSGLDVRLGLGKPVQLHTTADLNMPWRETASTMREGGRETGITSVAYALPFGPRFILDAGVRVRSMSLEPIMGEESTATQKMVLGGADWVVWAPSTQASRGQFLDDDLRWSSAYLANSLTLSYRHYEAFTEDDFGVRLDLAERNTIDEVSAVARNTRPDGIFGFELRGGAGNDWARDTRLWRVGSSLLVTPRDMIRGSLSYDFAKESTSGFTGERHMALASVHVDL